MGRLTGKAALITGGGTGIGLGIALAFAKEGAWILLAGRREARLLEAADSVGGGPEQVIWCTADVRDPLAMQRAVDTCVAQFGRLDILVCNAGVLPGTVEFDQMSRPEWDLVMDVNAHGIIESVKAAVKPLRAARGNVVIISSTSGLWPGGSSVAYSASKAAANMIGIGLARELAPDGVRVNVICPGWIETEMAEQSFVSRFGNAHREAMDQVGTRIPLGRMGRPADIAGAALYLAGPEAQWVTGAVLLVDGGSAAAPGGGEYMREHTVLIPDSN